ncbi:hypothetical protein VOLCADRAFT_119656, partial [Volvox carteri f. nagariensis]
MEEATVRVFWSPSPPAHEVTCVAVDAEGAFLYTGGSDGAIIRWQLGIAAAPKACVMLVGHNLPIRCLVPGLREGRGEGYMGEGEDPAGDPSSSWGGGGGGGYRFLLSVDDGGVCCLWREPCGRCELRRRIPQLGRAVFAQ